MKAAFVVAAALLAAVGGGAAYDYQADAHIAVYQFLSKEQRAERALSRIKATPEARVMLEEIILLNNKLSSGITMNELSDKAAVIKTKAQLAKSAYVARDDFEKEISESFFKRAELVSIGTAIAADMWRMTLKCYRDESFSECKSAEGIFYITELIGEQDEGKLDELRMDLVRSPDKDDYVRKTLSALSSVIDHKITGANASDIIQKRGAAEQEKKQ